MRGGHTAHYIRRYYVYINSLNLPLEILKDEWRDDFIVMTKKEYDKFAKNGIDDNVIAIFYVVKLANDIEGVIRTWETCLYDKYNITQFRIGETDWY